MAGVLCPYCVSDKGVVSGKTISFPAHTIDHANNGHYKEFCPMGGKKFVLTEVFQSCTACNQLVHVVKTQDGSILLGGHHFSWGANDQGERIKVAPFGSFFSRVMCNTHVRESPVFISENISGFPGSLKSLQTQPELLN